MELETLGLEGFWGSFRRFSIRFRWVFDGFRSNLHGFLTDFDRSRREIKAMQPPPPIHKEQRKMWCFVGLDKAPRSSFLSRGLGLISGGCGRAGALLEPCERW